MTRGPIRRIHSGSAAWGCCCTRGSSTRRPRSVYVRAAAVERRFDWFYLAGVVQSRLARHIDAAGLLKEAVALDPTSVPARLALADALFASDEIDAALAEYMRLTDGPGAPHAHYGVGRALAARGDAAAASRELEAAVALYPEFGAAWYALGMARRNAGPREEARAALARAQEFGARWPAVDDPLLAQVKALRDDASANAERGLQRERQGDLAGAIQAYEAAVAVDPATIAAAREPDRTVRTAAELDEGRGALRCARVFRCGHPGRGAFQPRRVPGSARQNGLGRPTSFALPSR